MKHLTIILLVLFTSPTWAINKCIEASSKITYTDEPCAHGAKVSQIEEPPAVTEADRTNAFNRAQQMRNEVSNIHTREAEELKIRQTEAALAQKELELKAQQQTKAKEDERIAQLERGSGGGVYYPAWGAGWRPGNNWGPNWQPWPNNGFRPTPTNSNGQANGQFNGHTNNPPPATGYVNPGPRDKYVVAKEKAAKEKAAQQP